MYLPSQGVGTHVPALVWGGLWAAPAMSPTHRAPQTPARRQSHTFHTIQAVIPPTWPAWRGRAGMRRRRTVAGACRQQRAAAARPRRHRCSGGQRRRRHRHRRSRQRQRRQVRVAALIGDYDLLEGLGGSFDMLAHGAARVGALVVGARVGVALNLLLPVLAPPAGQAKQGQEREARAW